MSNAVRVTTELLSSARKSSRRMGRSVAQQIDYWARLGRAFEAQPQMSLTRIQAVLDGRAHYDGLTGDEQTVVREEMIHRIEQGPRADQPSLYEELRASGLPFTDLDDKGKPVQVLADGTRKALRSVRRVK